ncbi:MAG: exodeoxyribonuclease III [Gammaproteobacteria bacterium]|nr:exodeoxyribonuclease III [Gammaproteobacteria bacterium]NIR97752.1 exodeoxyribonuclease III [Gammaproteobacteria bacterium]NIT63462.1 exodeoxyribonuclease III [Gammaproteobacteria bacterium]NIV20394.1 exodeoxyribonuclease III [Gammaproteobacteria bacterium]NIX10912.1 exodeoxyribonuclease III [Gammaproteobacteria bacterium]
MKIASWNVNSLKVRLQQVLDWLASAQPDLVGLQETKTPDEVFPHAELEAAGYRAICSGQKTYNGVAILSRLPDEPEDIVTDLPGVEDPQRRVLGATYGRLRLLNLYVPNGQAVGSDKYAYKLQWLARLADHVKDELQRHPRLTVIGDFNIAPEDRDVHDPQLWEGSVLVSPPERAAFSALIDLGLSDTLRQFEPEEPVFSWWDYRGGAFRRNMGLRIDLILASSALGKACTASGVDKEPRRWPRPSDHAPAVAEFTL